MALCYSPMLCAHFFRFYLLSLKILCGTHNVDRKKVLAELSWDKMSGKKLKVESTEDEIQTVQVTGQWVEVCQPVVLLNLTLTVGQWIWWRNWRDAWDWFEFRLSRRGILYATNFYDLLSYQIMCTLERIKRSLGWWERSVFDCVEEASFERAHWRSWGVLYCVLDLFNPRLIISAVG